MAAPSQGMMLNERPLDSVVSQAAMFGTGGNIPAPVSAESIGNYKGVMLCNRPFAGAAAAANRGELSAEGNKLVFVTGKVKSEVGFTRKNLPKDRLVRKRVKQETALTRHKKWLADLQLTKQALEEQYMQDLKKKQGNKQRFMQREASMRRMARSLVRGTTLDVDVESKSDPIYNDEGKQKSSGSLEGSGERTIEAKSKDEDGYETVSRGCPKELCAAEKRRKRGGNAAKPMWAMTEAKAEAEVCMKEDNELEELLEFTKGLDFDKYIRDAEVHSMIEQVKKRIAEIESQSAYQEGSNGDANSNQGNGCCDSCDGGSDSNNESDSCLEARILKLTDKNLRAVELQEGGCEVEEERNNHVEDDNISVARTAMSEGGRSIRSVHSTKSLVAVAEKAREGIVSGLGAVDEAKEGAIEDIVMITHKEDNGLRLGGKNTVSNLPYIRRNPAI
ncbi:unnamed protein product [Choristocarpus tenellus]